jgi:hypothetical protein
VGAVCAHASMSKYSSLSRSHTARTTRSSLLPG